MATVKICDLCNEKMDISPAPPPGISKSPRAEYRTELLPGVVKGTATVTISVHVTKGNLAVQDVCQKCIESLANRALNRNQTFVSDEQVTDTFGPLPTDAITKEIPVTTTDVVDQRKRIEP